MLARTVPSLRFRIRRTGPTSATSTRASSSTRSPIPGRSPAASRAALALAAAALLAGDEHEFLITPQNTALITIYRKVPQDLGAVGGPGNGFALDSILQEVDIATGRVLFEWHSLGNVALTESYLTKGPKNSKTPYDYFHINSVEPGPNDTLIVSARHTHAVYEISKRTGQIVWRLGGKRSDFKLGPGTRVAWQHDARLHPDGTLTIFDDGAAPAVEKNSRAVA